MPDRDGDTTPVRKHLPEKRIPRDKPPKFSMRELLRPHWKALTIGLIAVTGEGIANLLEPWPLKVVLDSLFQGKPVKGGSVTFSQTSRAATKGGPEVAYRRSRDCRMNAICSHMAMLTTSDAEATLRPGFSTLTSDCRWRSMTRNARAT